MRYLNSKVRWYAARLGVAIPLAHSKLDVGFFCQKSIVVKSSTEVMVMKTLLRLVSRKIQHDCIRIGHNSAVKRTPFVVILLPPMTLTRTVKRICWLSPIRSSMDHRYWLDVSSQKSLAIGTWG